MRSIWRWGFGEGSVALFWGWVDPTVPSFDFVPIILKGDFTPCIAKEGSCLEVVLSRRTARVSHPVFSPGTAREFPAAKAVLPGKEGANSVVENRLSGGKAALDEGAGGIVRGRDDSKTDRHISKAKSVKETFKPRVEKR